MVKGSTPTSKISSLGAESRDKEIKKNGRKSAF
jgi:hypothetical protein